jgi:hypothetical protein
MNYQNLSDTTPFNLGKTDKNSSERIYVTLGDIKAYYKKEKALMLSQPQRAKLRKIARKALGLKK